MTTGNGTMPQDPKAELLRQIRTLRRRIDPAVLAKAEQAAQAAESAREQAQAIKQKAAALLEAERTGQVPYDKEAARAAVMQFLQAKHDGGRFATKLMEELKRPDEAASAYGRAAGARQSVAKSPVAKGAAGQGPAGRRG